MQSPPPSSHEGAVRFSRVLRLRHLVALGASVTVGLGVFTLLGTYVQLHGIEAIAGQYLVLMALALPIVLTYAERSGVIPGSGGAYNLARHHGILWLTFGTGWLMIGGYAALVALLGWGIALHVNILTEQLFNVTINLVFLAALVIAAAAVNQLLGTSIRWRTRIGVTFAALVVLVLVALRAAAVLGLSGAPQASFGAGAASSTAAALMLSWLWGLHLIMTERDETQRPTRTLMPAMLVTVGLGGILGILAVFAIQQYPAGSGAGLTPLIDATQGLGLRFDDLVRIVYALFGVALTALGLNRVIVNGLGLAGVMTRDGFLPDRLHSSGSSRGAPTIPLLVFTGLGAMMLVVSGSVVTALWLSSLAFLWTAALVHLPDAVRSRPNLPKDRYPRLPFHPLFPGLVVAIGVLLPFVVGPSTGALWRSAAWILIGAVIFVSYSRQRGLAARRETILVGEVDSRVSGDTDEYRVMVGVVDPSTMADLVDAGARLARARGGRLFVLTTLHLPEQVADYLKRRRAQEAWDKLTAAVERQGIDDVPIEPLVRLAPTPTEGILAAVREEDIDLLLLSWSSERPPDDIEPDSVLGPVVKLAPGDVAILRGQLPESVSHVVVPTAGGPNAALALRLACDIAADDGEVEVVHVEATADQADEGVQGEQRLQATVRSVGEPPVPIQARVAQATSVEAGVSALASGADVMALGASKGGVFDSSYFGGLAAQIAHASVIPSIIARVQETPEHPWLERLWDLVSDPLPKLTEARREEVVRILYQSGKPSVDFFVLITLASAIAALGLLQDSAAVIIGAMLVAPLMSPILAMGMNMVLGDLRQLRVAMQATVQGVALAIIVGVVVVVVSPIDSPTNEILARTQPNVLDLMVALVSGAAAGYALSRSEVAAAMPGVAIAAALVPPLCVVGYGLGTSDFEIASGAMLLFVTNLIAIILAAAVVFLLLGFSPQSSSRADLSRGLRITALSLGVVTTILGAATVSSVRQINREQAAAAIFTQEYVARVGEVTDLTIARQGDGYLLAATVVSYAGEELTVDELAALQSDISEALDGERIAFDVTTLYARRETGYDLADRDTLVILRQTVVHEIEARGGQVLDVQVTRSDSGFVVEASAVAYEPEMFSTVSIDELSESLSETAGAPVDLHLGIVDGRLEESVGDAPVSTPEPTASTTATDDHALFERLETETPRPSSTPMPDNTPTFEHPPEATVESTTAPSPTDEIASATPEELPTDEAKPTGRPTPELPIEPTLGSTEEATADSTDDPLSRAADEPTGEPMGDA